MYITLRIITGTISLKFFKLTILLNPDLYRGKNTTTITLKYTLVTKLQRSMSESDPILKYLHWKEKDAVVQ